MDADSSDIDEKVNIMTLHSAKGLEFGTVFLPGWEEGLFPHQRSLDETGRAGLEEERRLAYVGITRAKRRAFISFAQNRRMHNLWQSALPSRFIDELPADHIDVVERATSFAGYGVNAFGGSRFDDLKPFANSYATPGWQRAQKRYAAGEAMRSAPRMHRGPPYRQRDGRRQLQPGRQGVPPEIRLWPHPPDRGQQAHRRFRQGGRKAGDRQLPRADLTGAVTSAPRR